MNGFAVCVVIGEKPYLGGFFPFMNGFNIREYSLRIENIVAERKIHITDRRIKDVLSGRIVDCRNLVLLDNWFCRQTGSRVPGGNHVHFLFAKLFDKLDRFGDFVSVVYYRQFDLSSPHSPFYLVYITEIILMTFGMILSP